MGPNSSVFLGPRAALAKAWLTRLDQPTVDDIDRMLAMEPLATWWPRVGTAERLRLLDEVRAAGAARRHREVT